MYGYLPELIDCCDLRNGYWNQNPGSLQRPALQFSPAPSLFYG